jgi:Ser/Thr protein kinase RdoA (MazF antagonist)
MMESNGIKKLLAHYDLGELIDCTCIEREIPQCQKCYHLRTKKGEFFVKRYEPISRSKRASFKVMSHLHGLDYPSVKFIWTRNGQPYVRQIGGGWAIFEYISQPEQQRTTEIESKEIGKWLARLHRLTVDLTLHPSDEIQRFKLSFEKHKEKLNQAPGAMKPYFDYIESNINNLAPPPSTYQAVCHGEFVLQHIRFKNEKVVKIIDWDNVGRDFAILDIGTTLSDALVAGRIDFKMVRDILGGYEKERPLTNWERKHLFEAMQFGAFKFAIWALEDIESLGWARFTRRLTAILDYDSAEFNDQLSLANP